MGTIVSQGFTAAEAVHATRLYWQAFGAKLGRVLGPDEVAVQFLTTVMDPQFALVARDDQGNLLGIAGYKTSQGSLVGGSFRQLADHYGNFGAAWRGLLLASLERKVKPQVFQMDGICVDARARGQGVGTLLLHAILDEARARGLRQVELDVIDTNPKARLLYERVGFRETGRETTGPLKYVFGFSSAARMVYDLSRDGCEAL